MHDGLRSHVACAVASVPRHVASRLPVYAAPVVVMHEKLELDARPPVVYLFFSREYADNFFSQVCAEGEGRALGPRGMKGAPSGMRERDQG